MPRLMDVVREFKDAPGFKDGWYYRLGDGHPWIGPFVTADMASRARAHVTRHVCAEPEWLKITPSVALGPLSLIPPRGGGGGRPFKTALASQTIPAALPAQATGYQVRPQLALPARREPLSDRAVAPQPATVPRRRGSRT